MPNISVIIATYNRHQNLRKVLEDLLNQRTEDEFTYNIFVIDNNSGDDTLRTLELMQKGNESRLRYEREARQGKPYALNRGIQKADGDILVFTDDDVTVPSDWLWQVYRCFCETGCDGMGGRVLPIFPQDTPDWIKNNAVKLAGAVVIYDYGEGVDRHDSSKFHFIGANFAFRRNVFDKCGVFRTDLVFDGRIAVGEDTEFVERVLSRKMKLVYCGKALVWHPYDPSRLKLRQMAHWHVAVGCFDALREMQKGGTFVCFFGIPRYLIKGVILDGLSIPFKCHDRLALRNVWRSFFRKIGMIKQYLTIQGTR